MRRSSSVSLVLARKRSPDSKTRSSGPSVLARRATRYLPLPRLPPRPPRPLHPLYLRTRSLAAAAVVIKAPDERVKTRSGTSSSISILLLLRPNLRLPSAHGRVRRGISSLTRIPHCPRGTMQCRFHLTIRIRTSRLRCVRNGGGPNACCRSTLVTVGNCDSTCSKSQRDDKSSIRPRPSSVQSRHKGTYTYINIYIICSSWVCMLTRRHHQWRIRFVRFVSLASVFNKKIGEAPFGSDIEAGRSDPSREKSSEGLCVSSCNCIRVCRIRRWRTPVRPAASPPSARSQQQYRLLLMFLLFLPPRLMMLCSCSL